jgi:GMC oxidoreductase
MLSQAQGEGDLRRSPNPLEDMDFYSDRTRSVYRPRYTVEELKHHDAFRYVDQTLALRFVETAAGVELICRDLRTGADVVLKARRLILAAGAMATTRLVLASLDAYDVRVPLLANPYLYMPCVNLAMLGRPAADRRHSLSQLVGLLSPPSHPDDTLVLSLYSYRALLLHKLVKEMPLPVGAGLLAARLLLSSLTVVGVNFPERPTTEKWMLLRRRADGTDELAASYGLSDDERAFNRAGARLVARALRAIGCIPFASIDPGNGSSIHYAGGLPMTADRSNRLGTSVNGRLHGAQRVYIADSANWSFLPAKGPTLTMMANARRVAAHAAEDLRASAT